MEDVKEKKMEIIRIEKREQKKFPFIYKGPVFLVCTPIFWTAFSALLMTIGVFAIALANSVLLAREYGDFQLYKIFSTIVISLASSGFCHSLMHFWFARFDKENRKQRLWLHLPLLLFFSAFILHNVFWYLGVVYEPNSFPNPNSASFSIAGFAMCFVIAFSTWYQARYIGRLYI